MRQFFPDAQALVAFHGSAQRTQEIIVIDSNGVSINKPIKIFLITSSTHLVKVQGPKTFLCLGDIYKSV